MSGITGELQAVIRKAIRKHVYEVVEDPDARRTIRCGSILRRRPRSNASSRPHPTSRVTLRA